MSEVNSTAPAQTLETPETLQHPETQEPRPPLGSWPRMYALVLGFEALLIVLFHFFTKAFE